MLQFGPSVWSKTTSFVVMHSELTVMPSSHVSSLAPRVKFSFWSLYISKENFQNGLFDLVVERAGRQMETAKRKKALTEAANGG